MILFPRSIPASAGQPALADPHERLLEVYPRECGAARRSRTGCAYSGGLSPRVRGSPTLQDRLRILRRSIPASAGQPRSRLPGIPRSWVYPRECGAAGMNGAITAKPDGLSPRVRGSQVARVR